MRILHPLSQRPEATGSGIYVRAMIAAAAARGHENFLLAGIPGDTRPEVPELPPDHCRFVRFAGSDLPFDVVGMSDAMPYDSCRFIDLTDDQIQAYRAAFERSLQAAVDAFRPDLIHSHHLWPLTALARRRFPDHPHVTSCHGTDLRQFRHCQHLRPTVAEACRRLDAVLALSNVQKAEIAQLYGIVPERIHVVGAGYDPVRFYPVPKPRPAPVRIVYAGKPSRTKGVAWLLHALRQMDHLPWQLELVGGGKGPEKEAVLDLAGDLGQRVTVAGLVNQAALAERMRRAHIFVLPSFFEGLPWSCSKPWPADAGSWPPTCRECGSCLPPWPSRRCASSPCRHWPASTPPRKAAGKISRTASPMPWPTRSGRPRKARTSIFVLFNPCWQATPGKASFSGWKRCTRRVRGRGRFDRKTNWQQPPAVIPGRGWPFLSSRGSALFVIPRIILFCHPEGYPFLSFRGLSFSVIPRSNATRNLFEFTATSRLIPDCRSLADARDDTGKGCHSERHPLFCHSEEQRDEESL